MDRWPADVIAHLADRIESQLPSQRAPRFVVGIAGPPAAGKSTMASMLVDELNSRGDGARAQILPMDGFHMRNGQLDRRGLRGRKGAPETFEVALYLKSLERARAGEELWLPIYSRDLHDVVERGLHLSQERIVVTEGNYLLSDLDGWRDIPKLLDLAIYIDASDATIRGRLMSRHVSGGKTMSESEQKVDAVDMANARVISQHQLPSDLRVNQDGDVKVTAPRHLS